MLAGKFVTLGITGSIAAFKAANLASLLSKTGVDVHVVMTDAGQKFVTPLTFQALTKNHVHTGSFGAPSDFHIPHIALAQKADLIAIAPATADILGKIAHGIADDLLTTIVMAATCPVLICPAMNVHMYNNSATQANLARLKELNYLIMEAGTGYLACGEHGQGRFPEPELIYQQIIQLISPAGDFRGISVLITAGGTREPLDPVRFISNRSSGKMGFALARSAATRGADVTLVSAPTNLPTPPGIRFIPVETAAEMQCAVVDIFPNFDVVIKAAAVADFRPAKPSKNKIKKDKDKNLVIEFEKNTDILMEIGKIKKPNQVLVGFAAETENMIESACQKIEQKNLDLIVSNDITLPGAGFDSDTNIVKLIYRNGEIIDLPLMDKLDVAGRILDAALLLHRQCP
ncbi:MAG: Phosphopantothenoylcysteine decarboxylase/phosphopantothenate/cysteine ligase [Desulfotomaculum sp. 46_296]|nr:MAG: Phosphopantothenoylcysteine decarboxylase/phosphopantothenate/cysteine ligase [Desulfotomaculum sp. 46_296]HAU32153.1 bifunctional phosphopantothenoylcysteine decarboxylase/phosphopantothenate--cysteine ligase CoaBC [Desulfotomaculum sp.]